MVEPPTRDPFLSIFHSCAAQIPLQHCSEPSCLDFFRNRQTSSMSNSCLHQETSSSISVEVWNASNLSQVPQLDPVPLIFQSQVKLRSKYLKVSQVSCWLMLWGLPKTIPQRIRFLKLEQCVFRGTLTPCIWTNTYMYICIYVGCLQIWALKMSRGVENHVPDDSVATRRGISIFRGKHMKSVLQQTLIWDLKIA